MNHLLRKLWRHDEGQDNAGACGDAGRHSRNRVGTIRLIGSNANTVFSQAASSIQSPARMRIGRCRIMSRKRGNPNWGRPIAPVPARATEFELRVS